MKEDHRLKRFEINNNQVNEVSRYIKTKIFPFLTYYIIISLVKQLQK